MVRQVPLRRQIPRVCMSRVSQPESGIRCIHITLGAGAMFAAHAGAAAPPPSHLPLAESHT
eukprot:12551022-Heterocapsa_arctica.AAC.1